MEHTSHLTFTVTSQGRKVCYCLLSVAPGPRVQQGLSRAGEVANTLDENLEERGRTRATTRARVGQSGWKDTETTDPTQAGLWKTIAQNQRWCDQLGFWAIEFA